MAGTGYSLGCTSHLDAPFPDTERLPRDATATHHHQEIRSKLLHLRGLAELSQRA
jgi:hypothetical protein